ncbi:MAG TPA: hypothetical protein VEL79_11430 [Vicinamibacterales bacterium]|nr:hypothetical protein [Vicinamibacterales bacterium]
MKRRCLAPPSCVSSSGCRSERSALGGTGTSESIAGGILGGLTGVVVGAVTKNATLRLVSWWTFVISLGIGLGLGEADYPQLVSEDRLVYVGQ